MEYTLGADGGSAPSPMFVGHLAAAFVAKRVEPRAPLATLVGAAFALDLIWPLLLATGIERVRIDPGNTAFTPLAFEHYPWTHSLSMTLIWSIVVGRVAAGVLKRARAGLIVGLAVLSHWLLDAVTHRPDLPLWPGGPLVGLGLWDSIPATIVVEGALFAASVALYARSTRPRDAIGKASLAGLIVFTAFIWMSGPFSPPPPSVTAIVVVGLALWLLPLWAWWIERHRLWR